MNYRLYLALAGLAALTLQPVSIPSAVAAANKNVRIISEAKRNSASQAAAPQKCQGFFECVFGKPRVRRYSATAPVQVASAQPANILSRSRSREVVDWNDTTYPVGSLVVSTPDRALYYITGKGEALRYAVGVGREGFQWSGHSKIVAKQEWPSWTPPKEMIRREHAKGHMIPDYMEGGPENPLGARALYIGGTIYRVHGTNNEASIGGAVSSGCIRMMNADVIDLYERVKVGTPIYVFQ